MLQGLLLYCNNKIDLIKAYFVLHSHGIRCGKTDQFAVILKKCLAADVMAPFNYGCSTKQAL
jgi:hypothetical protein